MTMTRRKATTPKTPRTTTKAAPRPARGKLPITGFRVTRNALVVHALREYVKTAPTAAHDPEALSDSDGEGE